MRRAGEHDTLLQQGGERQPGVVVERHAGGLGADMLDETRLDDADPTEGAECPALVPRGDQGVLDPEPRVLVARAPGDVAERLQRPLDSPCRRWLTMRNFGR
ncbi:MAG TPA: hypothetical protein VMT43_12825 [Acidimicrobiales bacterium]|nr:hypothetical protein [Acidimicrobiales bacterium]